MPLLAATRGGTRGRANLAAPSTVRAWACESTILAVAIPPKLEDEADEDASDPEMEAFANEAIKKEMQRMQSAAGAGDLDSEQDVDYSESEQGSAAAEQEEEGSNDFFSD